MEWLKDQEIRQVEMERPHVVILGAGASRQAFPAGDRNGRAVPLMLDFVEVLQLGPCLREAGLTQDLTDFESVYSEMCADASSAAPRGTVEDRVYDYFSKLRLAEQPCLYDYLVLSLREKDVIATFNWDPFLIQACRRNTRVSACPKLLFLHGNVLAGYCLRDKVAGSIGARCRKCREAFSPTPLLYPIGEKDYDADPFISWQWGALRRQLREAFWVTIFGYSAPESDTAAVELMREVWTASRSVELNEFELIDIKGEERLERDWEPFMYSHHYQSHQSFYDSWIARHPRRSGEAYINQYLEARFIEDNPLPDCTGFDELWDWFGPLTRAERSKHRS